MKAKILLLCMLVFSLALKAQTNQQISKFSLDSAVLSISKIMANEIKDDVKLIGIGDVAVFSKETQAFNIRLSIYLILEKGVRNILLTEDEWALSALNDYMTATSPIDSEKLHLLMQSCQFGHDLQNDVFKVFLTWLKNYNLSHRLDMINIYGISNSILIPSSYFLAKYVTPIDRKRALLFAKKWDESASDETQCLKDIQLWYNKVIKSAFKRSTKNLLEACKKDLLYNAHHAAIHIKDQKVSADTITRWLAATSNRVLSKVHKKSILLGDNKNILKCYVIETVATENRSLPTLGKLLDSSLHKQYFACVTDFCSMVKLPIVDSTAQKINLESIQPSDMAKILIKKKDRYFQDIDAGLLSGFLPSAIPFAKGFAYKMVHDSKIAPFDALFLFKEISALKSTL